MPDRYTLPGTKLPEGPLPPTILFHRWQAFDRFEREKEIDPKTGALRWLEAFRQEGAKLPFLRRVAEEVQKLGATDYVAWNKRFARSCGKVGAECPLRAVTLWRLVVGWGTNPTFETGLTLDHLLGFPFIPGSAVKGLLHRMAEQELLEERDGTVAIPALPDALPAEPPPGLTASVVRARRVRALFGSLHLRRNGPTDPEAPYDRLAAWLGLLAEVDQDAGSWAQVRRQLARLCSDASAGGMVTCFDAVPAEGTFGDGQKKVLAADVLTPHTDNKPNPIPFLAVQPGVTFELRYRLAAWPALDPREQRDPEERERAADLGGIEREAVAGEIQRWLVRGLHELGLGGKTSAGYGYLLAEGTRLAIPKLLAEPPLPKEPKEILAEPERLAQLALPRDIPADLAVAVLDKALKESDSEVRTAVVARFKELFPEALKRWRSSQRQATRKRMEAIDRLLGGNGEGRS